MTSKHELLTGSRPQGDPVLDQTLRPRTWQEYVGQDKIKKNLRVIIDAAKKRGEPLEHLLFYGSSGLGKTTISYIIAQEMGANIKTTSGPAVEKAGDLAAILTNLSDGDILFIDECHRLNKLIEEYLYPAMEDFKLNIIIGKGPMANTMELSLPRFTSRMANRLLKRVRDFAQVEGQGLITKDLAKKSLELLEIDGVGLEFSDRKILGTIIAKFEGGPVGLQALAAATSEEQDALLDVYEPYLMQLGFMERTPQGRKATKLAYQHLGIKYKG